MTLSLETHDPDATVTAMIEGPPTLLFQDLLNESDFIEAFHRALLDPQRQRSGLITCLRRDFADRILTSFISKEPERLKSLWSCLEGKGAVVYRAALLQRVARGPVIIPDSVEADLRTLASSLIEERLIDLIHLRLVSSQEPVNKPSE